MNFMNQLMAYDKENIKLIVTQKVDKYIKDPRFFPELINKQSHVAMSLCMWVRAMMLYDSAVKGLESKKSSLKEAEGKLQKTADTLSMKRSDLVEVEGRVAGLVRTSISVGEKKDLLEAQIDKMKMQMVRRLQ